MSAKETVCHQETFSDALLRKAKRATYETKLARAAPASMYDLIIKSRKLIRLVLKDVKERIYCIGSVFICLNIHLLF